MPAIHIAIVAFLLPLAAVLAQSSVVERALPRNARVRVSTEDGAVIASVAPFGAPRGQETAGYDIALPVSAISHGRVRLRLEVIEPGGAARPPAGGEIGGVELRYVPVTR